MNGANTIYSRRPYVHERERLKIVFQYTLMVVASFVAGWILPRFFGDALWQDIGKTLSTHFDVPFSALDGGRAIMSAVFSYVKPTLVCIGIVAVFSFSSLSCLVSDIVLVYLGMRAGCTLSILTSALKEDPKISYRPSSLCVFFFVLFTLLVIVIFWFYSIQAAKSSYQLRRYSKEGRAIFSKKAVGILAFHTLWCTVLLFLLHLLYAFSIYFVSK